MSEGEGRPERPEKPREAGSGRRAKTQVEQMKVGEEGRAEVGQVGINKGSERDEAKGGRR